MACIFKFLLSEIIKFTLHAMQTNVDRTLHDEWLLNVRLSLSEASKNLKIIWKFTCVMAYAVKGWFSYDDVGAYIGSSLCLHI